MTIGIFTIVTTEILPIGLLTSIADDFTITDGMAGLMMTMPGLVAAVAAPVVTVATARIDRRRMLCLLIFLLMLANALMAAAPCYWMVLLSRVLVGITVGGFWSIAAGLAERLVAPESVGRANTVIFSSVPLGSVFGVPAGTFLGGLVGWRTTFATIGVLTAGVLALLILVLPPLPARQVTRVGVLRDLVRDLVRGTPTRIALLLTFLVVLAHFGAYTYVTPFLEQVTHVGPAAVTLLLLAYGGAGVLGNFLGGSAVRDHPRSTTTTAVALSAAAMLLLPLLGRWDVGALVLLLVWGVGYGAVPVSTQAWFARAAPAAPEAASVLFTASFQATISFGALLGGVAVDRTSPSTVLVLGGSVSGLAVLTVAAHIGSGRTLDHYPRGNRPAPTDRAGSADDR